MLGNADWVSPVRWHRPACPETQYLRVTWRIEGLQHDFGDPLHRRTTIHRGALNPLERLRFRHSLVGLQQTLGALDELAGLEPIGQRGDFVLERGELAEH